MQAVVMCAGESTRTHPLTVNKPKPLLMVCNKAIIQHTLDALVGLVDEVVLIVGFKKELIIDFIGDSYKDMKITYIVQEERLGTGHAVLSTRGVVHDRFIVMNGDDLYSRSDIERLLENEFGALAKEHDNPSIFGVFDVDEDNRIRRIVEKPTEYISNLCNIGCYVFPEAIFEKLENAPKSPRGEIELTSGFADLAAEREAFAVPVLGYWLPIGYPWNIIDATEVLIQDITTQIDGTIMDGVYITGDVVVGARTVIKPGTVIEGPVIIGEDCIVGPSAYLRAGTVIGNHCKIGNSSEIKNSTLFEHVAVPHLSVVGDSVVGERTNIAGGCIFANFRHDAKNISSMVKGELIDSGRRKFGAIIAEDVRLGINTSIYPGRKLWPNAMTVPGDNVKADIVTPPPEN